MSFVNMNQKVGQDSSLLAAARKKFQETAATSTSDILYNKLGPDGRTSEASLSECAIDTLSLRELASTHQQRPWQGTSLMAYAYPMLPLTSPIEARINRAAEEQQSKQGVWIGKGVWLKQGELPPQQMVLDTGNHHPSYLAYTHQMQHINGAGTSQLSQVL